MFGLYVAFNLLGHIANLPASSRTEPKRSLIPSAATLERQAASTRLNIRHNIQPLVWPSVVF